MLPPRLPAARRRSAADSRDKDGGSLPSSTALEKARENGTYQRVAGVGRGLAIATNSVASRTPGPNGVGSKIR
jgi:hypothetical protein